jgi:hypothetical protein
VGGGGGGGGGGVCGREIGMHFTAFVREILHSDDENNSPADRRCGGCTCRGEGR